MSTPSATSTALITYELLERILLHTPIHTLFTTRRVSKTWLSLLNRSLPLQQAMFLVPSAPAISPTESTYNDHSGRTRTIYPSQPLQLNPSGDIIGLVNQPAGRGHRAPLVTFGLSDQNLFLEFEIEGIPIYDEKLLAEEASWRGMLVTQPPITAVHFRLIRRDPRRGVMTIFNPKGVTFGDLQDMSGEFKRGFERPGEDKEVRYEGLSFCLFHPFTEDQMEEAW
ncbi:hypothetical protein M409DRAFT_25652 [Zasmidium cellare ATCC 36951]|uniref:F-box domain-containing protein n=1 Tax=Zasmidium cellare ATCC 36951 TaxID=1080233 RepID=A0A6A6CEL5_ZASCE|nr:uncharacterized protein M409DRAFT_25652 [Zasmidium cellare ATCC 36951]KAF2163876.1 hypothetical protein M409DRAFT_25652 [Zasmidium cellare ATCC 36951]